MTTQELKERTKQFSLRVLKLVDTLGKSRSASVIANQLARSGASVGSNYRAACRARSRAEFIAKLGVVEEEADESAFWLELVVAHALLPASRVEPLLRECNELVAIMAASRISAARNARQSAVANRKSPIS